jgi:DNA-binding SARP family transcriptional activator
MTVEFGLLGLVEATVDGCALDVGHARQRLVLAALAVDAGHPVPVNRLIARVWGDDVPERARATLYSYLSRLRRVLAEGGGRGVLARHAGGYVLVADDATVDVHRFRELVARSRATGLDDLRIAGLLAEAQHLWRGEALAGLESPWAAGLRQTLERERHAAELHRTDARLRLGLHHELLPVLTGHFREHPLDERLAAQLMLALYRSGRTADALRCFDQVRRTLAADLGSDPGPELRQLHQRVLAGDPTIGTADATDAAAPHGGAVSLSRVTPFPRGHVVPRQLPAAPRWFTGRGQEVGALDKALGETGQSDGATAVCAISGCGGVGKTSLALHWAHRRADRFPDGQLHVDLRGFGSGQPVPPSVALRVLLDALGADPAALPEDEQALTGLYRTLVADRRMLLVLDDAADTEQVAPLLPGGAGCAVLVTSRRQLTGLAVAHGAHLLPLRALTASESWELLARHLGADQLAANPEAARLVVESCAGLPLAISVVGARAAGGTGMAALTGELRPRDRGARWDTPVADPEVLPAGVSTACPAPCGDLGCGAASPSVRAFFGPPTSA